MDTMTKTVSGTNLALATAILFAAGGIALIAAPGSIGGRGSIAPMSAFCAAPRITSQACQKEYMNCQTKYLNYSSGRLTLAQMMTISGAYIANCDASPFKPAVTAGTLDVQVDYGNGNTYTESTSTVIGTPFDQYTVFRITAQNEPVRITDLTLTAEANTNTPHLETDFSNVQLYLDYTPVPFAQAAQFDRNPNGTVTYTFSNPSQLLTITPGTVAYIRVRTDITNQGTAVLGDTIRFIIASPNDIQASGAASGSRLTGNNITLGTQTMNVKQIVPANVLVYAVAPITNITQNIPATGGTILGSFEVKNNGNVPVTINRFLVRDSGTNSDLTAQYELYKSDQNGNVPMGSSIASAREFLSSNPTGNAIVMYPGGVTIQPGSYVTLFIKIGANHFSPGDTWNFFIGQIGDVNYAVTEADLGYDGTADGDIADRIIFLWTKGKPQLGTITKS